MAGRAQCSVGSIDEDGIRYGFAISASKTRTKATASASVRTQSATVRQGRGRRASGLRIPLRVDERELLESVEARDADTDEPECAGALAQRAVEQAAGELADRLAVVGPGRQRGRAAADREVRVAELGGDGSGAEAAAPQALGEPLGH